MGLVDFDTTVDFKWVYDTMSSRYMRTFSDSFDNSKRIRHAHVLVRGEALHICDDL